ncbi:MAG: DegT/DnrJ/EryC1/StrS family aminotransferase [Desulfobacter sp.]|nr:MAG: DegT/DnrJ/EryC1/StrS family aminotransferase [Desulfobacter sp.]
MSEKRIFLSPPHLSGFERQFVEDAFDSNYIAPLGPQVDAFEREFSEYTGIKYCVALSSGTAAMHIALRELGVGPGDEVIASSLTFIGSVTPVVFLGADLVFLDCDRKTWNMNPELLKRALEDGERKGRLPKAVIPTDLYGQCADYETIFSLCKPYDIPVIVDAAESVGAKYKSNRLQHSEEQDVEVHAGKGAKAAVFSFNGNKIITTSGGGMLASDDSRLIERARFLSQQAKEPFPYYEHAEIGYNYRMSNVLAGIGRGQLKVLDERVRQRRAIFNYYEKSLKDVPGIEFMPEAEYGRCNRWLSAVVISPEKFGSTNNDILNAFEKNNIEARPIWKPMHLQPVFQSNNGSKACSTKVYGGEISEDLFNRGLCLPSGSAMSCSDMDRIVDIILTCNNK